MFIYILAVNVGRSQDRKSNLPRVKRADEHDAVGTGTIPSERSDTHSSLSTVTHDAWLIQLLHNQALIVTVATP